MGVRAVVKEYLRQREHWDQICDRCSICCHERELTDEGELAVNWSAPCEFLDEKTALCSVYEDRFRCCPRCRKVTLLTALFNKTLPPSCAYVRTFRPLLLHGARYNNEE